MGEHTLDDTTSELQRVVVPERQRGQHRAPRSPMAVAGFVVAIVGLPFGWLVFGLPSFIAIWISVQGIKDTSPDRVAREGRWQAMTGLALGVLGGTLGLITLMSVLFY